MNYDSNHYINEDMVKIVKNIKHNLTIGETSTSICSMLRWAIKYKEQQDGCLSWEILAVKKDLISFN